MIKFKRLLTKGNKMNLLTIILTLFFSSLVFGGIPRTHEELLEAKKSSENIFYEFQSSKSHTKYLYLGIKESSGEATLFKSRVDENPLLEWEILLKDEVSPFDLPVKDIFVNEDNSNEIFVWTEEGIFVSETKGSRFEKDTRMENPKTKEEFLESVAQVKNNSFTPPTKYTNQVNDLPPIAILYWDTIFWDSTQVLLNNIVSPPSTFSFMHGRVAVGDSGLVHLATVREDNLLRYYRSTDYGETFEPEVVLLDSIGGAYEIFATGDYVYIYSVNSIIAIDEQIRLFVSSDKGQNWSLTSYPFSTHSGFVAEVDTAYEYQETGAGGSIWQARSYDGGNNFSPYSMITDTVYATLQRPTVAVGDSSLIYMRTGGKVSTTGTYVYRSTDFGNTWELPVNINPPDVQSVSSPELVYNSGNYHSIRGGVALYARSLNEGATFENPYVLCHPNQLCYADYGLQISAYEENVFVLWVNDVAYPDNRAYLKISRDNGDSWSKELISNQSEPNFTVIPTEISIANDDSLVYIVYLDGEEIGSDWHTRLNFRRGFYKFPKSNVSPDSIEILSGVLPSQIDTSFTITNDGKGNGVLSVSKIELPSFVNLINPADSTFILKPDSTKNVGVSFDIANIQDDSIKVYTNDRFGEIKTIFIKTDIGSDLEEKSNEINSFSLSQNYPNPFNPTTVINYELQIKNYENAKLTIFNILGEEVVSWRLNQNSSNYGKVVWDGTDRFEKPVSSGVYLYRLQVGNESLTKKMLLLR
ncbi:MAG: T9SS C-terminal target domain-containing protein [Calditrichaeota bacterium]|nr:MAG: T9SS C-terminal target domain-containing protein [Calditrichota bacterium]